MQISPFVFMHIYLFCIIEPTVDDRPLEIYYAHCHVEWQS